MGVNCQIFIQKTREGVHTAGKPVIGTVRYSVDEPTEYKDIVLSLIGKAQCTWTETKSTHVAGKHRHRSVTYRGTEVIVANYVSVLNKAPGATVLLPIGSYEHNFKFMLPEDIPPSFKDSTSKISYEIRIKFQKSNFFSIDKKFATTINVYGSVKAETPEGNTVFGLEKSLLRPFSRRNHVINVKADISNTIFSPGQNADISFMVTNVSDVKLTSVKTELLCYTTYTANCGRRKGKIKVIKESTVETPSVPSDAVANMTSVLPVQAHLYSIQNCKVIRKEYKVKVTLRLPMPYINSSVEFPIVIGEKRDEKITEGALFAREAPGPSVETVEGSACGPPSYWEVMNEDLEDKEDMVKEVLSTD